jgi:hypothetical protein
MRNTRADETPPMTAAALAQPTATLPIVGLAPLETVLGQRQPLTHETFMIALNDRTGNLRLNAPSLGLVLAGTVLGELVLSQHLVINGGELEPLRSELPADPFLARRFARMLAEPGITDVSTWLRFFATEAVPDTARELQALGWLHIERWRSAFSRRSRYSYQPVRTSDIAWRPMRLAAVLSGLNQHLHQGHPIPWEEVLLAELLDAVGLLDIVLWNSPKDDCRRVLRWCLTQHPTLHALVRETISTHAAMVQSHLT